MEYSKDGITVAAILDKTHPRKNGLFAIRIRVTYKRMRQYYSTGKELSVYDWERMPTAKGYALKAIRESVANSYEIVRKTVETLAFEGRFSFDALNECLRGCASDNLNAAFREKIADLQASERIGSASVYDNVLKNIERFKSGNIPFDAVTVDWLRRYERFLSDTGKSRTTISIHMRHIRAILNEAQRSGKIKETQYPFGRGKYEIQTTEARKMALTLEQIGQIARYNNDSQATAKYRDYWLFLYLCNGINVADFVRLRYSYIVDGEICFIRQKTERTAKTRKQIHVIISDPMRDIIARWGNPPRPDNYIFPVLTGTEDAQTRKNKTKYLTRAINKHMMLIADALDISHISTYTARHSFATVLKRSGANISYISESLGHADLKTTENYLDSFERGERERNATILTKF